MEVRELAPFQHLGRELAATVHDAPEHLVVCAAREEDLAREELVEGTSDRPYINGKIILHAENNLRGTVEARHKIRRDFVLCRIRCGAQVADLQHVSAVVDEDVVGLEVGVEDVAFAH